MFSWRECLDFSSTISKNTRVGRGRVSPAWEAHAAGSPRNTSGNQPMGRGDGVSPEGLSLQRCDRVILLPPHLPTDTARSWTSWEDEGRAAAPNPLSPCSQGPSAQEHGARAPAPGAQLSPRTYISDRNRCVGCGRQPGPGGSAGRAQRPAGGAGHGAGGQEHRSAPARPAVAGH